MDNINKKELIFSAELILCTEEIRQQLQATEDSNADHAVANIIKAIDKNTSVCMIVDTETAQEINNTESDNGAIDIRTIKSNIQEQYLKAFEDMLILYDTSPDKTVLISSNPVVLAAGEELYLTSINPTQHQ